ncbi:HDIG domain-containing protein [Actinoplanes sp. LDG1-06]|uniref:HDIG domain-containing protein n=1 Tax=Paractinoplanes ovalisporus TaxID=2810368 RepID=A0ABS2AIX7_9ACTN|nr:HD domain-containing protein [Actinoplanes ovalisporus]MBM2619786.1 HDIG domain-containing protein [Actinoplanes ovalisporus]
MDLPTDDEIRALHERFAPSPEAFDLVWTHCTIVRDLTAQFPAPEADPDLVRAGALLHDIGVYRLQPGEAYIRHGVLGHELLRSVDLPEVLARFCSHHTGVGLTRDDVLAQSLPLPPEDYLDETPSETLVMYADKFHSKSTPPRFVTIESYTRSVGRFGPRKAERFAELVARYGEPDLESLARRYGHDVH